MRKDIYTYNEYFNKYVEDFNAMSEEQFSSENNCEKTENNIIDIANDFCSFDYHDFFEAMQNIYCDNKFVVVVENNTWNGKLKGVFVDENSYSLSSCLNNFLKNYDNFKLYQEKNSLHMECSHHDSTNFYEIVELRENIVNYDNISNSNWKNYTKKLNKKLKNIY